jgi:hypothetical protein
MATKQSDIAQNSVAGYKSTVFEYLRQNGGVASKAELRRNLNIPDWYIT